MKSLHSLFESKNIEFDENNADLLSSSDGGGTEHLENEDLSLTGPENWEQKHKLKDEEILCLLEKWQAKERQLNNKI